MAEDKKNQIEEPLQDEQLDEVSGGLSPINLVYHEGVDDGDVD